MDIIEKRKDIVQIFLVIILTIFSVIFFFFSLLNGNTRDIWLLIGVVGIVMIVLSELQGVTVFIAVVLLGTLVAREEFILETSALFRGEKLSELRDSRTRVEEFDTIEKISGEEISERLTKSEIDIAALSPDELVAKVEEIRKQLTVERASTSLTDESKKWIKKLSESGGLHGDSKEYKSLLKIQNGTGGNFLQSLEVLGFVNWLTDDNVENDFYVLTEKGIALAEKLRYEVKPQVPPKGYY